LPVAHTRGGNRYHLSGIPAGGRAVAFQHEVRTMILRFAFLALLASSITLPSHAALKAGDAAPDFKAQASLGGAVFTYSLADALKKGPVVLYFYPAAFTTGCTMEAHDFAEAVDAYGALGATVIGVSHDDIDTLKKFSVSECRGKFAVAADKDQSIMKSYDAVLAIMTEYANRVSYVISPDGRIVYSYTALSPEKHVPNTLDALRKWTLQQKK
jgi:thioredoxin-dependent peroxiredoxin